MRLEASRAQLSNDLLSVLIPSCLKNEQDLGPLEGKVSEGALVVHLDDVGRGLCQAVGKAGKGPRNIIERHPESDQTPATRQASLDDRR